MPEEENPIQSNSNPVPPAGDIPPAPNPNLPSQDPISQPPVLDTPTPAPTPVPEIVVPAPTPDPAPAPVAAPEPISNPAVGPTSSPIESGLLGATPQPSIPEPPAPLTDSPVQPAVQPPPAASEEPVGPPWLRTGTDNNPMVNPGELQNLAPGLAPESAPPPPWQAPAQQFPQSQEVDATSVNKEGGFPVIIFVVIVLAILIAIGVFLFVQGALPF